MTKITIEAPPGWLSWACEVALRYAHDHAGPDRQYEHQRVLYVLGTKPRLSYPEVAVWAWGDKPHIHIRVEIKSDAEQD